MLGFVIRRLVLAIPVLLVATCAVFLLVAARGDPLAALRTDPTAATTVTRLTAQYHLDDPLPQRYARWLGDLVRGDWGTSFETGRPVAGTLRGALRNTLILVVPAVAVSLGAAVALGVLGAIRYRTAVDHVTSGLAYLGLAMPVFWLGLLLQLALVVVPLRVWHWRFFSIVGLHSTGHDGEFWDLLRHLVLPVLTLSVSLVAAWSRYQRSSMLDELSADYVRAARARGVPERAVVLQHALRNALLPFVTISALTIGSMVGGVVVTERVFSWPGMGTVFVDAIGHSDYPVILGWLVVVAVAVVLANLAADIAVGLLSPRSVERA